MANQASVLFKAGIDELIAHNAERAKKHNVTITFEYLGHKYTVSPAPVTPLVPLGKIEVTA